LTETIPLDDFNVVTEGKASFSWSGNPAAVLVSLNYMLGFTFTAGPMFLISRVQIRAATTSISEWKLREKNTYTSSAPD